MAGERNSINFSVDTDPNDADQNIDALLIGSRWDMTGNIPITFSFTDSASDYSYSPGSGVNFANAFNATQQQATRDALAEFASVINVTFSEQAFGSADGTLRFAEVTGINTAFGYYPNDFESGGDMAFNTSDYNNPTLGSYAFHTIMHEIGHAMGLRHGHEGGSTGSMTADRDGMEYSVMTYNSFIGQNESPGFYTNSSGHYAQTLMMYDIAALQRMYGANWTENNTGTTYTFSTTTGEMFINGVGQGTPGANVIFRTVWDGGGTDTYDFANFTTQLNIDLTPGAYSDLDVGGTTQRARLNAGWDSAGNFVGASEYEYASGHLYNALQFEGDTRSLIENAVGGSAGDIITGNAAKNNLWGGAGDDDLFGGSQKDKLYGGTDEDSLYGGTGRDTLYGNSENDKIWGGDGGDKLYGGDNDDTLYGNTGADTIFGGSGNDKAYGGDGSDILEGKSGNDRLYGSKGDDTIYGQDGEDKLYGGGAKDRVYGGNNNDTVYGNQDDDRLYGGNGNDKLYGGSGSDILQGNDDNDTLYGNSGQDRLNGGSGDDTLYGGSDADTFIYNGDGNNGSDVIMDFKNGSDRIEISGSTVFSDLTITQVGDDKVITWGSNSITLDGITGNINIHDFDFV